MGRHAAGTACARFGNQKNRAAAAWRGTVAAQISALGREDLPRSESRRVRGGAAVAGPQERKTTIGFYAGINTKRASRAHAKLIMQIREQELAPTRRRKGKRKIGE